MTTIPAPDRTASRLTDADRDAVRRRLEELTARWARIPGHYVTTADTLTRSACHAIGCTAHDLRPSELLELADLVADHLAPLADPTTTTHAEPATGHGTD